MRIQLFAASILGAITLVIAPVAQAATSVVTVTPTYSQGWEFNPDPTNATPYNFTNDQHSIGYGSLYVQPIGPNPLAKFIAAKPLGIPTANLSSLSYDFMIAGNGTSASANQFYLNVYTNLPRSTTYYDCRFDYVPTSGSTTGFTTASFDATSTPTDVASRGGASCPTTLAGMPSGSTASAFVLNLGDTTANDTGLAGYFDNVVVKTTSDTTIYDFELYLPFPTTKDDCKNGGWKTFTDVSYKNQGQCVSYMASNGKALNHMSNTPTF